MQNTRLRPPPVHRSLARRTPFHLQVVFICPLAIHLGMNLLHQQDEWLPLVPGPATVLALTGARRRMLQHV